VPSPWPQHVVALHALEPRVDVHSRSCERVAYVQWSVHVRIRKRDKNLLALGVGVSLEYAGGFPLFLPFLLDLLGLAHETVELKRRLLRVLLSVRNTKSKKRNTE
jgi:hypothetical protein